MAKKSYTSKGQRPNVGKNIRKAMRRDYLTSGQQLTNNQSPAQTKIIVTGQQSGAILEFTVNVRFNTSHPRPA